MDREKSLSADDVAKILKVSKSTIYNLVKDGTITSYKVGRKLRFSEQDLKQYIDRAKRQIAGNSFLGDTADFDPVDMRSELGFIICGQDLILDVLSNYMRLYGVQALRAYIGSYDSLISLYKRKVHVASSHLWDGQNDQYNAAYVKRLIPGTKTMIIHLADRMQGFYVKKGNPKQIKDWEDFRRDDIVMINREFGSGSRVLLDENLKLLGIYGSTIKGYDKETQSHLTVAGAVSGGRADIAIGNEKIARQVEGIDFIPMKKEKYDLVIRREDLDTPEMQTMLKIIRSRAFREEFENIGGYDVTGMGDIVAEI